MILVDVTAKQFSPVPINLNLFAPFRLSGREHEVVFPSGVAVVAVASGSGICSGGCVSVSSGIVSFIWAW